MESNLKNKIELAITLYNAYLLYKQARSVYEFCDLSIRSMSTIYGFLFAKNTVTISEEEFAEITQTYVLIEKNNEHKE